MIKRKLIRFTINYLRICNDVALMIDFFFNSMRR